MVYLARPERRAAILEATMAIALEEGLAATTVRRVAQAIQAAVGQVHHHFGSVAELRAEAFATLTRRSLGSRSRKHAGEGPVALLLALLGHSDAAADIQENRLWNEAMLLAERDAAMKAAFAESIRAWHGEVAAAIRRGQAAGLFAATPPDDSAWRLIGLSNGLYGLLPFEGLGVSKEVFNRHILTAIERELGAAG